jgi:hypothetical protein
MNERKPSRKRGNTAEEQQAYRTSQKALGRPTSDVVAMAVFRCLVGRAVIKKNDDAFFQIEDLVVEDLLRRCPDLTRDGIRHRYESMSDELVRLHEQGLFDT